MKIRQRLDRLHTHPAFPAALRIAHTLQAQGFEAVFAGGCVRDGLLGIVPKDLDLATSAKPEDVEAAFARTLAVGKAFGTMVVVEEGHNFEVTTFRKEGPYLDGRHPSQIEFTEMEEDAQRRDFTVNALFYDPARTEVIDWVDGMADLEQRRLRAVGRAEDRFAEDHLRMLRAVRFVAQLGFELEPLTKAAIAKLAARLKSVSAERVLAEMKRFLASRHLRQAFALLTVLGLGEVIWPEVQHLRLRPSPDFVRWENAFAALMWQAGKSAQAEGRLKAWKASKDSQRLVHEQLQALQTLLDANATKAQRLRALGQETYADTLVLLEMALAENGKSAEPFVKEYLAAADSNGKLPSPFLSGQDLLSRGVQPGAKMGELLKSLYDQQLEGKIRSKAEALERIQKT